MAFQPLSEILLCVFLFSNFLAFFKFFTADSPSVHFAPIYFWFILNIRKRTYTIKLRSMYDYLSNHKIIDSFTINELIFY